MKKLLLLIAAITIWSATLGAQIVPGLHYPDLKYIYNIKEYRWQKNDPYSPALSAVGSLFIPGIGQFCCGETGRGIGLFAGGLAIDGAFIFSATQFVYFINKDEDGNVNLVDGQIFTDYEEAAKWAGATIAFGLVAIGYGVFSSIDAVKVAKIRNMYWRDLQKQTSLELDMRPSLTFARKADSVTPVAGMTLSVKF